VLLYSEATAHVKRMAMEHVACSQAVIKAEAGRNGLRPLLVKSRFMRTERTQNSHWSEVPHELISCKYLTRTTFRNVILKLAFNQWRIKP
jgi:hypothetical protein